MRCCGPRRGHAPQGASRRPRERVMQADWNDLSDDTQIAVSREAFDRAAARIAAQAEMLADEMELGPLRDRGGPDALRLFAAVVRSERCELLEPAGRG